jgi:hypothetical protein
MSNFVFSQVHWKANANPILNVFLVSLRTISLFLSKKFGLEMVLFLLFIFS